MFLYYCIKSYVADNILSVYSVSDNLQISDMMLSFILQHFRKTAPK